MNKIFHLFCLGIICLPITFVTYAVQPSDDGLKEKAIDAIELTYQEREPGVDPYTVTFTVSKDTIRIDEADEDENTGYIIYDDKLKRIYSVSHYDKKTLLIKKSDFSVEKLKTKPSVEYLQLSDAPEVSGKVLYNYRLFVKSDESETTCAELQIAEGLLPEVAAILKRYQNVISGQQVKMLKNTIEEVKTSCYLIDQVYNQGLYFDKGLPIQEWHSNNRSKILTGYKNIKVSADVFAVPEGYNEFSITLH